jgi:hypothetical protein
VKKFFCASLLGIVSLLAVPAFEAQAAGCTFGCGSGSPIKCGTCYGNFMYMGLLCSWYQVRCNDCSTGEYVYEGDYHVECYI